MNMSAGCDSFYSNLLVGEMLKKAQVFGFRMGGAQRPRWFERIDTWISHRMRQVGVPFLRYAIAIVFIWFGMLKLVGFSPAAELVVQTVYWVDSSWFVPLLGWWEVLIGVCFLVRPLVRAGIALLVPQMVGTFLPLVLLPDVVYQHGNPLLLTLAGQYIVKNLLIIGAAIVIGAGVRYQKSVLVDV
jgi:uncharacterized membrane protein YkgB